MGDLEEKFAESLKQKTPFNAKANYWYQTLNYIRPFAIKDNIVNHLNPFFMFRHHFKIGYRTLVNNKGFSLINICGLAVGMTVAILIGLWVLDEFTYNKNHEHYDRIARVQQHRTMGTNQQVTWWATMLPLAAKIREEYGSDFERAVLSTRDAERTFKYQNQKIARKGLYMELEGPELLSVSMIKGEQNVIEDPSTILISDAFSKAIFGSANPIGKVLSISDNTEVKVGGIYKQFPPNSDFHKINFIGSFDLFTRAEENAWLLKMNNPWGYSGFQTFVQLAPHADFETANAKIKNIILENVTHDESAMRKKPMAFLHPMSRWRLYSRFENGRNTGGFIETIQLFGAIGMIVLLLACINFMNLSTARSEKRAKEVGVRKAIGSNRSQLIKQFFSESLLVAMLALVIALILAQNLLPWFNQLADKQISITWNNPFYWALALGFVTITGLIAGSYPALYLSSFKAVKALKGTFKIGRFAAVPRKILMVIQFTLSTAIIIGTITIYQQIQHAQNRPLGYNQQNLAMVYTSNKEIGQYFDLIKKELEENRIVESIAKSTSPITDVWGTWGDFDWKGKDPTVSLDFPKTSVTYDYGKAVGWQFVEGRNFSSDFATDTAAFIINEAAAAYLGFENPIGEIIKLEDRPYQIIGIIKNMLIESPYQAFRPYFYDLNPKRGNVLNVKLNPQLSANESIRKIEKAIKKHESEAEVHVTFVDEAFGKKFNDEKRIGTLVGIFAALAIFISCLGLFGLTAYMAERRAKEIGIRKVLGASVQNLWRLLSKDFLLLVLLACFLAIPIAWCYLQDWLANFDYRTTLSAWIFLAAGFSVFIITLITVSF